jgi:alpha/beta superfamily hydrolase
MRLISSLLCVALFLAPILLGTAARAQEVAWEQVTEEGEITGTPGVLETRWVTSRPPGGPYDRIQLHRYRGRGARKAALLYLPGAHMTGEIALGDEDHNLWIFLARRGVEVYALDYRTHFVPNTGDSDLAFMRGWGLEAFVEDARAAAGLARSRSGAEKLFVAGFSRGACLAYALAALEASDELAGLIVLDGSFKNHSPEAAFDLEAALKELDTSGAYARDVAGRLGWEKRHELMTSAATDPAGPALDPEFATVGEQVAAILYRAWGSGALANPLDGASRVEILARLLDGYDRYTPAIQSLEARSIAQTDNDPRTPIDDGWGEFELPVLYFGANGPGADWLLNGIYSAARSGSGDVTVHVLEGHGHLDVLVGEDSRRDVFEPALLWIEKRSSQ